MPDDLVQQLAEVISDAIAAGAGESHSPVNAVARAVLASGLVVSTSDVLNLAQQHDHRRHNCWIGCRDMDLPAELRALTEATPPVHD